MQGIVVIWEKDSNAGKLLGNAGRGILFGNFLAISTGQGNMEVFEFESDFKLPRGAETKGDIDVPDYIYDAIQEYIFAHERLNRQTQAFCLLLEKHD